MRRSHAQSRSLAIRTASVVTFFILWELIGQAGQSFVIRPPSEVIPVLLRGLFSGELLGPILGTMLIALTGFAIAALLGVTIGALLGLSRLARDVFNPFIDAAFCTPMAMLIPVLGVYVGLETTGKVFLVVVFAFFVILLNTMAGFAEISPGVREMARAYATSGWETYRRVLIPAASPGIITGLRLGIGRAFQGAVLAELMLSVSNLGSVIVDASGTFNMPALLAAILLVTMLAVGAMSSASVLERRALAWKRSEV